MAKLKVYVIHDSAVEAYMQPFMARSNGEAIRTFSDHCNDNNPNNLLAKHPEQFTLFETAEYDEATGRYTQLQVQKPLGTGLDFRRDRETSETISNLRDAFKPMPSVRGN